MAIRRKGRRPVRTPGRRKPTVATVNRKVNKLAKATKPELKRSLVQVAEFTQDRNLNNRSLFQDITKGDLVTNRIGNSIKAISLHMRFHLKRNPAATQTSLRLIIFRWKDGVPDKDLVLETPTVVGTYYLMPYRFESRHQYQILYDKVWELDTDESSYNAHLTFPLKNLPVNYDSVSAIPNTNDIQAMWVSNENTNMPAITVNYRMFYTDA